MDEADARNSTRRAGLEPLAKALDDWFASDRKFIALPRNVRAQVRRVRGSALLMQVWDTLSPLHRRAMVRQLDLSHDEAVLRHEVRARGFEWREDPTWTVSEPVRGTAGPTDAFERCVNCLRTIASASPRYRSHTRSELKSCCKGELGEKGWRDALEEAFKNSPEWQKAGARKKP